MGVTLGMRLLIELNAKYLKLLIALYEAAEFTYLGLGISEKYSALPHSKRFAIHGSSPWDVSNLIALELYRVVFNPAYSTFIIHSASLNSCLKVNPLGWCDRNV